MLRQLACLESNCRIAVNASRLLLSILLLVVAIIVDLMINRLWKSEVMVADGSLDLALSTLILCTVHYACWHLVNGAVAILVARRCKGACYEKIAPRKYLAYQIIRLFYCSTLLLTMIFASKAFTRNLGIDPSGSLYLPIYFIQGDFVARLTLAFYFQSLTKSYTDA